MSFVGFVTRTPKEGSIAQPETIFDREGFLAEEVFPHGDLLERIFLRQGVAVVAYKPRRRGLETLRALGWDGSAGVFELSSAHVLSASRAYAAAGDTRAAQWLTTPRQGRICFACSGRAEFINYSVCLVDA